MEIVRESDFTSHGIDMVWEGLIQRLDELEIEFDRNLHEDIDIEVSKSIADVIVYNDDVHDALFFENLIASAKRNKTPYGDDWVIVKPVSVS